MIEWQGDVDAFASELWILEDYYPYTSTSHMKIVVHLHAKYKNINNCRTFRRTRIVGIEVADWSNPQFVRIKKSEPWLVTYGTVLKLSSIFRHNVFCIIDYVIRIWECLRHWDYYDIPSSYVAVMYNCVWIASRKCRIHTVSLQNAV